MFTYYKKDWKKRSKIPESMALEINERWVNVFVEPDGQFKIYKNNNYLEWIDGHLPITKLWDYSIVWFDVSPSTYKNLTRKWNNKVLTLLEQCLGDAKKKWYLKFWKIRDGHKLKQIIEPEINVNKIGQSTLKFLIKIAKDIFNEHSWDWREIDYVDNVNDSIKVNEIDIKKAGMLVNEKFNFILDFSKKNSNLSWKPFKILLGMNNNVKMDCYEYIYDKYGVEYDALDYIEIYRVPVDDEKYVVYTNKNVFSEWLDENNNSYKKVLFRKPIDPIGITKTDYDISKDRIMDTIRTYYVVKIPDTDETITLSSYPDPKAFNRIYMPQWLAFRWRDLDLLDFYDSMEVLSNQEKIKTITTIFQNGYDHENKIFVHGWEVIKWNPNDVFCVAPEYKVSSERSQKTLRAWLDAMHKVYDKDMVNVVYLWMIWAMSKSLFTCKKIEKGRYPFLILTGDTTSGKSTLVDKIRWLFEFDEEARKLSLEGTSPQPILHSGRERVPMFFDEYTGNINPKVDSALRWFYDEIADSKGRMDGNEKYIKVSPLIICGEQMPQSTSVVNRSIMIPTKDKYKCGTRKTLWYLNTISVIDSRWNKVSQLSVEMVQRELKDIHDNIDIDAGNARLNDNYKMLLLVNRLFDVINEQELIDSIKKVLTSHRRYMDAINEEISVLASAIANSLQQWSLHAYGKQANWQYSEFVVEVSLAWWRDLWKYRRNIISIAEKYSLNLQWDKHQDLSVLRLSMNRIKEDNNNWMHVAIMALLNRNAPRDPIIREYLHSVWYIREIDNDRIWCFA